MIPQVLSQGPVLLLILAPVLTWCHQRHQDHEEEVRKTSVRVSSSPLPSDQIPSLGFTLSLAATWLPCYALNLVISELYIVDSFAFLIVKEPFTEYCQLSFLQIKILRSVFLFGWLIKNRKGSVKKSRINQCGVSHIF